MKINIHEFVKERNSIDIEYPDKKKLILMVLKEFEKNNIRYCILRNYDNLGKEKDVDILTEDNKNTKIDNILSRFGLNLRYSYSYFRSYKGSGLWFDMKVGALSYYGIKYKDFDEIKIKKNKNLYILDEKEEFVHLILHSIFHKNYFVEKYKKRINYLMKKLDYESIRRELENKFKKNGCFLLKYILKNDFEKALMLKKPLLMDLFKARDIFNYISVRMVFIYGKTLKIFLKNN